VAIECRPNKFVHILMTVLCVLVLSACTPDQSLPPVGSDNFATGPESKAKTYYPLPPSEKLEPEDMWTKVTPIASDRLREFHVGIYPVGEDMLIVLPSEFFFYPNSSHMNPGYRPVLDGVIKFINRYDVETIKVAGYTDAAGNKLRNKALSRQQAQNVARYLWRHNLNARYVYATGYGSEYPIANNVTPEGRLANRRVQITFRRLTPES